jgi:hypothetical protein
MLTRAAKRALAHLPCQLGAFGSTRTHGGPSIQSPRRSCACADTPEAGLARCMLDLVNHSDSADNVPQFKALEAKLQPARIRSTLAFAGLYQLTHEQLKRSVLDQVKGFFGHMVIDDHEVWWEPDGEDRYKRDVLRRAKNPFRASLLWLIGMDAISPNQAERLEAIFAHRHELTHELAKYIVDVNFEPDVDLFVEALATLKSIARFWTDLEVSIGTFDDHGELNVDDVTPLSLLVLQMCIDAYVEGVDGDRADGVD